MQQPWPDDEKFDQELLEYGDTRNVEDRYRYWSMAAIREDMTRRSSGLEVAVENLERDYNLGTIVRNANAFNVRRVHIIGRRQWNKRGAMKTDAYLEIVYHKSIDEFLGATQDVAKLAVDNVGPTVPIHEVAFPERCVLIFGSEGAGISTGLMSHVDYCIEIPQFGSTRSINVGVASGILMYKWVEDQILSKKS